MRKTTFGFEVISEQTHREPFSTKTVGVRRVRCPECGHTFTQGGEGGCFTMVWMPIACPKCGFPLNENLVNYAAVTIARNEEKFIGDAINSVLSQTVKPSIYVVVDDGSTDFTPNVISSYPVNYVRIDAPRFRLRPYNLCRAVKTAVKEATRLLPNWAFLLKVDADSMLPEDYVENLLLFFHRHPRLGIASGVMRGRHVWRGRASDGAKMYRRECWDQIGGLDYVIAWDTHAIIKAYMKGWTVASFPSIEYVERRTSKRETPYEWYLTGLTRHLLGFPLFHTAGVAAVYMNDKPYVLGSLIMLLSHLIHKIKGTRRPFTDDYYRFARRFALSELMLRLRTGGIR